MYAAFCNDASSTISMCCCPRMATGDLDEIFQVIAFADERRWSSYASELESSLMLVALPGIRF